MEQDVSNLQMLVLERRDSHRNLARFYVLAIEPTLLGDSALVREWGRIGFVRERSTFCARSTQSLFSQHILPI
jgi:predicted DNA-binding WGR domain protein